MDEGSGDGDDKDDKDRKKDGRPPGKLIALPGGKKVDAKGIGAGYVVGSTGDVPTPDVIDPVQVSQDLRDRQRYVESQEIVQVLSRHGTTSEALEASLLEIAEELAHLKWDRRTAAREGKSTANLTASRINGLRSLVELLLKRKEAALAERLDLKSPRFQAVFAVWMQFFYESMEKTGIEAHVIDLVFQQMKADMIGWETKMDLAGVETVLLWIGVGSVIAWGTGPSIAMSILSQAAGMLA